MMKSKHFCLLVLLFVLIHSICHAENPILSQRYTADPVGLEVEGRLYLWTSHDIDGQKRYSMNDITCVSTVDLQNWIDHGEVFKVPEDAGWAKDAWAPTVVKRNDTFFLYTGDANRSIGVASSSSPTGPFKDAKGAPVISRETPNGNVPWCFDPTVFIDDDGQAYCVFGGGPMKPKEDGTLRKNARIIKLGDDMISTEGRAITIDAPGFYEGGYLHARTVNGVKKYYFSYFSNTPAGMDIAYMISDNLMDGWEYKGVVLNQPPENYNNSHASIFPFKDKWYLAYHTRKIGKDRGIDALRQRSVCVDELFYNEDGTIKPVVPTSTGPAQLASVNPYVRQEAEMMAAQSYLLPGIEVENIGKVRAVTKIDDGDWIKIAGVDFADGATKFEAIAATPQSGGAIEVRLDAEDGPLLGTCSIKATGAWDQWKPHSCQITGAKGKHDLYLKFTGETGDLFNLDAWMFFQK